MDDEDSRVKKDEISFDSTVVNNGSEIKINRAGHSKVKVNFYKIDLELYFSEFPFQEVSSLSAIAPTKSI